MLLHTGRVATPKFVPRCPGYLQTTLTMGGGGSVSMGGGGGGGLEFMWGNVQKNK